MVEGILGLYYWVLERLLIREIQLYSSLLLASMYIILLLYYVTETSSKASPYVASLSYTEALYKFPDVV